MVIVDIDSAVDIFPSALATEQFPDLLGGSTAVETPVSRNRGRKKDPAANLLNDLLDSFDGEDYSDYGSYRRDKPEKQKMNVKSRQGKVQPPARVVSKHTRTEKQQHIVTKKQQTNQKQRTKMSRSRVVNTDPRSQPVKKQEVNKQQRSSKPKPRAVAQNIQTQPNRTAHKTQTPTDDTSEIDSRSSEEEIEVSRYVEYRKPDSLDEDTATSEITPSSDESSESSESTTEAEDLLARAQERVLLQRTTEELKELRKQMEKKNEEIEILAGQLRRATETKCDLVLLQTEMELHHEQDLTAKNSEVKELAKANYDLQEIRAEVERVSMRQYQGIVTLISELTESINRSL